MPVRRIASEWYFKRPLWAAATGLILLGLSISYWLFHPRSTDFLEPTELRVSSPSGGSYQQTIRHMVDYINSRPGALGFTIALADIPSEGSLSTLEQMEKDQVDISLVQGDTLVDNEHIGGVLEIYSELYLFYSNHPTATTVEELCDAVRAEQRPLRVASIGEGSQVFKDLLVILDVYGIAAQGMEHRALDYAGSERALRGQEIDLAFIVGAFGHPVVRRMAAEFKLLDLTSTEGLLANLPGVERLVVPRGLFGNRSPRAPLPTVTTPATLIANQGLSSNVVRRLTTYLLANRANLRKSLPHLDIRELKPGEGIRLHEGALRAIQPEHFWVLSRYESLLKFGGSVVGFLLGLFSLATQVSKFRTAPKE